jgi:hypothetical protein
MTCGALPENFSEKDTLRLLGSHCPAMKLDGMQLLEDSTIVVSAGLLSACEARFQEAAAGAVDQAVASGKLAAAPSSGGGGGGGKGGGGKEKNTDDWSDDEDDGGGKRGKGKKKKSARALLKEEAAAEAESKSRKGGKKGRKGGGSGGGGGGGGHSGDNFQDGGGGSSGAGVGAGAGGSQQAGAAALTPSIEAMAKDMLGWYEEEHDMSEEVARGVAEVLRPALVKAYVEAHRSAFASMAESRKKKQAAFEAVLQQTADNIALFHQGAETVGDVAARTQLAQHLLKEHGVDVVASASASFILESACLAACLSVGLPVY